MENNKSVAYLPCLRTVNNTVPWLVVLLIKQLSAAAAAADKVSITTDYVVVVTADMY